MVDAWSWSHANEREPTALDFTSAKRSARFGFTFRRDAWRVIAVIHPALCGDRHGVLLALILAASDFYFSESSKRGDLSPRHSHVSLLPASTTVPGRHRFRAALSFLALLPNNQGSLTAAVFCAHPL
jgi:hypothetical protein